MKKQNKVVHLTDASLPEKIKLTKKQINAFEYIAKLRDEMRIIEQQIDGEYKAVWESIKEKYPFVEHSPWYVDVIKDAAHRDRFLRALEGLKSVIF